jgi:hypothetical protein
MRLKSYRDWAYFFWYGVYRLRHPKLGPVWPDKWSPPEQNNSDVVDGGCCLKLTTCWPIAIGTLPQSCEQTQFRRFPVWRDILYYYDIDIYTCIETCAMYLSSDYGSYIICSTCPASWTSLPRTLKSKSLIIYSLSSSFAKLNAVLSLL